MGGAVHPSPEPIIYLGPNYGGGNENNGYVFQNTPCIYCWMHQFSSVQSLSRVWLFVTPFTAHQASLSITNFWSSLKLTSIKLVMPSSHLFLCRPLLLLPPISPSIRVFCNESTLRMRWLNYWSLSFSISPSQEHPGLISFRMDSTKLFLSAFLR